MADTQDMINQLLGQTTVAPTPSFMGLQAPSDPAQLQALLGKLQQQQAYQQATQPTGGEYGYLHDAGKAAFTRVGQQLGNMLSSGVNPTQGPQGPAPTPPMGGATDPTNPGPQTQGQAPAAPLTNPQAITQALMKGKQAYGAMISAGVDPDTAQYNTLKMLVAAGVPGADGKLADAQTQVLANQFKRDESSKDNAQGQSALDEIANRKATQANSARERDQADTRLGIEQQNADTESRRADITAANTTLSDAPPTPAESILARKMADGDLALPSVSSRNPKGARLAALAFQMNPDLTQETYPTRQAAFKAIGAGQTGNQVRSFNVAYSHLNTAEQALDALNNGDMPTFNKVANIIAAQTGSPAPTNLDTSLSMIKGEIAKGIIGSHAGEADRAAMLAGVNSNSSPAQIRGAADQAKQLILGQASGVKKQFSGSLMGQHFNFNDALSPDFKRDLDTYEQKQDGGAAPTTPAAAPPATGWGQVKKTG